MADAGLAMDFYSSFKGLIVETWRVSGGGVGLIEGYLVSSAFLKRFWCVTMGFVVG